MSFGGCSKHLNGISHVLCIEISLLLCSGQCSLGTPECLTWYYQFWYDFSGGDGRANNAWTARLDTLGGFPPFAARPQSARKGPPKIQKSDVTAAKVFIQLWFMYWHITYRYSASSIACIKTLSNAKVPKASEVCHCQAPPKNFAAAQADMRSSVWVPDLV